VTQISRLHAKVRSAQAKLLTSFFLVLLVSICLYKLFRKPFQPEAVVFPEDVVSSIKQALPRNSIRVEIRSAQQAKANHLFWANFDRSDVGVAFDVLGDAAAFSDVFPGYPLEMARDENLWSTYFKRDFTASAWTSYLSSDGERVKVAQSWIGCLDIFARYGADVLLIGNSETYDTLIPIDIAKSLAPMFEGRTPRVLSCAGNSLDWSLARSTIQELGASAKQKPTLVIIGVSLWAWMVDSPELAYYRDREGARLSAYLREFWGFGEGLSLSRIFPSISWGSVLPDAFQERRNRRFNPPAASNRLRPTVLQAKDFEAGARVSMTDRATFVFVEKRLSSDQPALERIATQLVPYYDVLSQASPSDCENHRATQELIRLLDSARYFGHQVIAYLTPTTPLLTGAAPPCMRDSIESVLRSQNSENVTTKTGDWVEYGLRYGDFIWSTQWSDVSKLDVNHTNSSGAEKVTAEILKAIEPTKRAVGDK
jgi:hypothetical protein